MLIKSKKTLIFLAVILLICVSSCTSSKSVLTDFFKKLEVPQETSSDIILLNEYNFQEKVINVVWTSSNESVITNDGKVTTTDSEQIVVLVAEASYKSEKMKKVYEVKVSADNTDEILEKAAKALYMEPTILSSLSLPQTLEVKGKNVTLVWSCDHPEIMDENGNLTRPKENTDIIITAKLSLNGKMVEKKFAATVPMSDKYLPGELWSCAEVFKGELPDAKKPTEQSEFAGAIYHKVVSSYDSWLGIEVVVTLPEFIGDEGRTGKQPQGLDTDMRYLDNASVYLGGHCQSESDVGLTWCIGAGDVTCSYVDYSKSIAFRPFWRYSKNYVNTYENSNWKRPEYYYYPGDTIRMSVYISSNEKCQLRIELLEETTIEKYAKRRASYMLGDDYSKIFKSPEFESRGSGLQDMQFKRVCALDQANNEGKPTQPTNAKSVKTIWKEVYLYRLIDGAVKKVPMTSTYSSTMSAPVGKNYLGDFTNAFEISYEGIDKTLGGEIVTINPNNRK